MLSTQRPATRTTRSLIPFRGVRQLLAFRLRGLFGALVLLPIGAGVLFSMPILPESSVGALTLNAAGWLFFLLYMAWRVWATLFIGGRKDLNLQTEGPYSLSRNPLYFGSLCYALSAACFLKSFTFGAAVVFMFLIYARFVIRDEEHALGIQFGESFKTYCRQTPRFWPKWTGFHTPSRVSVELKRLKAECIRLSRAALLLILLEGSMHLRESASWPHWFHLR